MEVVCINHGNKYEVFIGNKFSIDAFSKDMKEWALKKDSDKFKYFRENLEWIK